MSLVILSRVRSSSAPQHTRASLCLRAGRRGANYSSTGRFRCEHAFLITGFFPLRSTLKAGLSGSPFLVISFPLDSMVAFSVCFSVT